MRLSGKLNPPKNPLFWAVFAILLMYTAILLYILVWALISTFKNYIMDFSENVSGLPKQWVFDNYEVVMQNMSAIVTINGQQYRLTFGNMLGNTLLYTVGSAFVSTFVPCITAYAVARFSHKFKWLGVFTFIVLVTMIIPIVGSTPSEIEIATALGLYDSIWGMFILKGNFLGMYYLIFLGVFKSMPKGFEEAAKIDGASNFTVFFKIYLPLAFTTFSTIMLIKGIGFWNDYQTPMLYLPNQKTLAQFFFDFINSDSTAISYTPMKLVGAMILIVPILLLFIFLNKKIMGNLSLGGLKE